MLSPQEANLLERNSEIGVNFTESELSQINSAGSQTQIVENEEYDISSDTEPDSVNIFSYNILRIYIYIFFFQRMT